MTQSRLNYVQYLQQEVEHLNAIEVRVDGYPLDSCLVELVKLRVSQINSCSFCVSYHSQRLRQMHETTERMEMAVVWQEAPCFSAEERAAFRWAEAVTRIADSAGISDELYAATVDMFGEEGTSQLTMAVVMINTWNRLAVTFQADHQHIAELLKAYEPVPSV